MPSQSPNYLSVFYWFYGDGAWMNQWDCTNHDTPLFITSCVVALVSFALHLVYAKQLSESLRQVREVHYRKHYQQLRNVFILCGSIHVLTLVASWFVSIHWIIVIAMLVNTIQCATLVISKRQILTIQAHLRGEAALDKVHDALELIHSVRVETAETRLEKIRILLLELQPDTEATSE